MKKLIVFGFTGFVLTALGMFGCKKEADQPAQNPSNVNTAPTTGYTAPPATTTAPAGPMGMPMNPAALVNIPCTQPTGQCFYNYCDTAAQRCKACAGPQDCLNGAACMFGLCAAMPGMTPPAQ